MRKEITNISNSTSIVASMPTPRPRELGSRHAYYLPLAEVLGHTLGLQPPNAVILEKYQRLLREDRGTQCLAEASFALDVPPTRNLRKLCCSLIFWFDGWDPNSSLCKANKTPIWSGTATLIFSELDGAVLYVTTRLIANGPGKGDHTEVVQCIHDDLKMLQETCRDRSYWVREYADYALVYPCVHFIVCDQPERRTITGLLAGNSKLHSCFGVTCHTGLLLRPLEACSSCIGGLEAYLELHDFLLPFPKNCTSCLQWTLPNTPMANPDFIYTAPVDANFPENAVAGAAANTHAIMITTKLLRQAWDEAFDQWIVHKVWNAKQVEAYFKVLAVNDSMTSAFVDQGRRCVLASLFRANPNSVRDPAVRKELELSMLKGPEKFVKPTYPPMWLLVQLDQLPEAIMHLAMGVVKAVSKFVHAWAAARNKSPFLSERMNFCINMHRKFCRIGRCPMATYSQLGKFPGWVADTFRTWWIWMPWFYDVIDNSTFRYSPYVLPTTAPCQWNGLICNQFLKSRAYPGYSRLTVKEKKGIVMSLSAQDDWPMTEVIPGACAVSGPELQNVVWHCHSLFKNLFAEPRNVGHDHAADGHVKLLLSHITKLDQLMNAQDNLPNLYETKYNFISLPRAVRLLRIYGSARNIQEGGTDGEGIVKMLRPLTPRGLKKHFARNLMDAFHRDQQLGELCDEVGAKLSSLQQHATHRNGVIQQMLDQVEHDLDASEDAMESGIDPDLDNERNELNSFYARFNNIELDDDEGDEEPDNDPDDMCEFVMDRQQFKKYKSCEQLLEYPALGLPLSVVFATLDSGSCIGAVAGNSYTLHLLPIRIGAVLFQPNYGFPYFQIDIAMDDESNPLLYTRNQEGKTTQHHSVVNYGHLLPHLPSLNDNGTNIQVPYSIVTTDGYHMNASYEFI